MPAAFLEEHFEELDNESNRVLLGNPGQNSKPRDLTGAVSPSLKAAEKEPRAGERGHMGVFR